MTLLLSLLLALAPARAAEPLLPLPVDATAEEAEALALVQEAGLAKYEQLLALRESDPAAYAKTLRKLAEREASRSPELDAVKLRAAELTQEFQRALVAWHAAADADKPAARRHLDDLAAQVFDLKQEGARLEIARAQERIARLEERIARQEAEREVILEKWVEKALEASAP